MNLLQLNKFGKLHNGKTIIFCKTDLLRQEFKRIARLKNEIVLISGNSDAPVDAGLVNAMPDNILTWYAQNLLVFHERLRPLPIGLENTMPNPRKGHGVGWPHALEKIEILSKLKENDQVVPDKLIYANFNIDTNPAIRGPVKILCDDQDFITCQDPSLSYDKFIENVLKHEATVCPAGNGIDTHRLYEVLYCNRVAITIKATSSPLYDELYGKLPVVILDTPDSLTDKVLMQKLIAEAKTKINALHLLDFDYWETQILNDANTIRTKPGFWQHFRRNSQTL